VGRVACNTTFARLGSTRSAIFGGTLDFSPKELAYDAFCQLLPEFEVDLDVAVDWDTSIAEIQA